MENKGNKKEKIKYKYNIFQNIWFAISNIWQWDKVFFLAFIPLIPISIFLPLAAIYFPALLVGLIEQNVNDATMLINIGVYSIILIAASLISIFCQKRIDSTQYVFQFRFGFMTNKKRYTMDYTHEENPRIKDIMEHTHSGNSSGESLTKELNVFFVNLFGIFTYGAIVGLLNPLILLLLIASTLINHLILSLNRRFNDKNRDKWVGFDRKIDYINTVSIEYQHAKDIKIYKLSNWFLGLAKKYQNLRMNWHNKTSNRMLGANFTEALLRFIRDGAAYFVLTTMFLNDSIDLASFIFFFGAIAGFSNWLASIIGQFNDIATHSVNINRLREFLELENSFNHGKGIDLPVAAPYEIEFKNVSYTYPGADKPSINNVSFKINKGERLAVVGINGAGKTTLVKLMCGLYYPTSGEVLLDGKDVKLYNISEYYTQFSAVFQDISLIPVPIINFLAGSHINIDRKKGQNALELAGLWDVINKLPNKMDTTLIKGVYEDGIDLSGGEKQKLMLARALYKDAPVIILDEPTAALDPIAENELYLKYAELTKNKTSVYISHRLSSTRFCDRIILIEEGKIIEVGSHNELMKANGRYTYMFDVQSHYYKDDINLSEREAKYGK